MVPFFLFSNNPRAVASLFGVNVKKTARRIITATKIDAFPEFLPRRLLRLDFVCDRPAGFNFGIRSASRGTGTPLRPADLPPFRRSKREKLALRQRARESIRLLYSDLQLHGSARRVHSESRRAPFSDLERISRVPEFRYRENDDIAGVNISNCWLTRA
jgi:hypothetical protein